jgi:hypothetical protein
MTQWVEEPTGGRDRGALALVRAWFEVLVRPRRFFQSGVAPGDQAPGLVFGASVVFVEEATRIALGAELPVIAGRPVVSAAFVLALTVVLVAPLALHLIAAVQTLVLILVVNDRGGISETVQVLAYASAPCVLAGLPIPALRVLCGVYGTALLIYGLSVVHGTDLLRATFAGALPAALIFGYGFRAFAAGQALLGEGSALLGV